MASLGPFAVDLIEQLGGRPTPAAQKLFSAWQRWEGGHTANAATWNPLNLTAPGSGLPTINSVGVVALPSRQAGLQRTASLIKSGYPSIAKALQSGQVDFQDPGLQADFNRWLTGKRTPGVSPYVRKIASSYGAQVPAGATPRGISPAPLPPPPQASAQPSFALGPAKFDPASFRAAISNAFIQGGGRIDLTQMPSMFQGSFQQTLERIDPPKDEVAPGITSSGPTVPKQPPVKAGKGLLMPANFKKTHDTSGLGWPAIDVMGKPGTPVRVPVGGTITRHGSAQGGQALYFRGDDGQEYWLGHVEGMLPVGTRVPAGGTVATISPDHAAPHAHWAKR